MGSKRLCFIMVLSFSRSLGSKQQLELEHFLLGPVVVQAEPNGTVNHVNTLFLL